MRIPFGVIYHGNRAAPVSLARHEPIAQAVIGSVLAANRLYNFSHCLSVAPSAECTGMSKEAIARVWAILCEAGKGVAMQRVAYVARGLCARHPFHFKLSHFVCLQVHVHHRFTLQTEMKKCRVCN